MSGVDVLAVMHSALGDLMAAQVIGLETGTSVPELSRAIDAISELIEAGEEFAACDSLEAQKRFKSALSRVRGAE